jgi:hypothetical protein
MFLSAAQIASATSRRERLIKICSELPEANHEERGEGHIAFQIRKKTFAYYLFDHHGDGRIAFCCKSILAEQRRLIREDPESFFSPAYLGKQGWVAVRLDLHEVDWTTVDELAKRAFQSIAPRKLAALLD